MGSSDMFKSASAPFLLTLVISMLGWYVGRVDADIRSTRVGVYWVERGEAPNSATAFVQNVSRTTSLNRFTVLLVCDSEINAANTPRNRGVLVSRPPVEAIDPVLSNQQPGQIQSGEMSLTTSLAPGGTVGLDAHLADCTSSPQFRYRSNPAEPFLMVEASSLNGLMLQHYSNLLLIVFFILTITLLIWIGINVYQWRALKDDEEQKMPEQTHNVRLSLMDAAKPSPKSDSLGEA